MKKASSGPPQYCVDAAPSSPAQYQAAFDQLFDNNVASWIASDGGIPVALPDGRIVWFFGDTLLGSLNPDGSANVRRFASNGFVVQSGACFQPVTEPLPGLDSGSSEFYWPTDGLVDNGKLRVFSQRYAGRGVDGLNYLRVDVATFSLPNLTLESITPLPVPTVPNYGASATRASNGYVYAYGMTTTASYLLPVPHHWVARAPLGQVLVAGAWRYWDGTGWNADATLAREMQFTEGAGPHGAFSVTGLDGSYVGSAVRVDFVSSDYVESWSSRGPAGPWSYRGVAADARQFQAFPPSQVTYGGRIVNGLPGSPFVIWSTHNDGFSTVLADPNRYKVIFAPLDALAETPATNEIADELRERLRRVSPF